MTERVSKKELDGVLAMIERAKGVRVEHPVSVPTELEANLALDLRDCRAKLAAIEAENARLREERDAWRSATGLAGLTPEEAADKIDADDAERHRLREALMPFAEAADFDDRIGDATPVGTEGLTEGDLRRAKKALEGGDAAGGSDGK